MSEIQTKQTEYTPTEEERKIILNAHGEITAAKFRFEGAVLAIGALHGFDGPDFSYDHESGKFKRAK